MLILLCIKSVGIRSYSGPYFPVFGLNTERYSVRLRIHSECGKIETRVTPKVLQSSQENTCATNFLFLKKKLQVALVAASGINFYIKVRASVESSTPGNLLFCDNSPFFANFFILVHGNSKFLLEISNFRNPKPL